MRIESKVSPYLFKAAFCMNFFATEQCVRRNRYNSIVDDVLQGQIVDDPLQVGGEPNSCKARADQMGEAFGKAQVFLKG
jgi:hypothetical protein